MWTHDELKATRAKRAAEAEAKAKAKAEARAEAEAAAASVAAALATSSYSSAPATDATTSGQRLSYYAKGSAPTDVDAGRDLTPAPSPTAHPCNTMPWACR